MNPYGTRSAQSAPRNAPSNSIDQFLNLDLLDPATLPDLPAIAGEATLDTDFSEMLRQYLAPEVAKLPTPFNFTLPPLPSPTATHPYAPEFPTASTSDSFTDPSALYSYSPSTNDDSSFLDFLPAIPGSPIGGFSPISDVSGEVIDQRYASPLGEAKMELGEETNWNAIDPGLVTRQQQPIHVQLEPLPLQYNPSRSASLRQESVAPIDENEEDVEMGRDDQDDYDSTGSTRSKKPVVKIVKRKEAKVSATKLTKTSVAGLASATLHPSSSRSTLKPVPEWADKPDPATYKALGSKEKRQLRNKISARNFRHRRKEYITDLEQEISMRDTIINELRDEVVGIRTENKGLKSEVGVLRQKWEEMMENMTQFTVPPSFAPSSLGLAPSLDRHSPPAPLESLSHSPATTPSDDWALDSPKLSPAILPPVASGSRTGTRGSNGIAKPNLSKDVAPGMKRGTGSWTTAGMGGGYMSVHTLMQPEFRGIDLKPYISQSFNPALNNLSPSQLSELPSYTSHLRNNAGFPFPPSKSSKTHDNFFESNPFHLRAENVEEYRGALYGKLANNAAGLLASKGSSSIPNGFRPAFFSSPPPRYPTGKESRDVYPSSDLASFQSPRLATEERTRFETNAYVATLATRTLFERMTIAFVDAFAGADPSNGSGGFSGEKVAAILSGKSKFGLVDATPPPYVAGAAAGVEGLGASMGGLAITPPVVASSCGFDNVCQRWMGTCKKTEESR